jgi:hypothetical protein
MTYDDNYSTCESTHATLRIYHDSASPELVSKCLSLKPSSAQTFGTIDPDSKKQATFKLSGWFLTTDEVLNSKDSRRHIDWLLQRIQTKKSSLQELRENGWWMDISCWWLSQSGHGGPTLSPEQMAILGDLGIELWFDVYFKDAPCKDSKGNIIAR